MSKRSSPLTRLRASKKQPVKPHPAAALAKPPLSDALTKALPLHPDILSGKVPCMTAVQGREAHPLESLSEREELHRQTKAMDALIPWTLEFAAVENEKAVAEIEKTMLSLGPPAWTKGLKEFVSWCLEKYPEGTPMQAFEQGCKEWRGPKGPLKPTSAYTVWNKTQPKRPK